MVRTIEVLEAGTGRPWVSGDMLDLSQPLVFTVADVMSPAECAQTVARIAALGPSAAPITTARGFVHAPNIRNNARVMFDDPALAAELFTRVLPALPDPLFRTRPVGANERFRGYQYGPGQRFAPHFDGAFHRSPVEESQLTFMVYLDEGCEGGDTEFLDLGFRVTPRRGLALLFQHRLMHAGNEVTGGVKHVLRSDIMYRRD
jgi:prolyl 4-hydroxylase